MHEETRGYVRSEKHGATQQIEFFHPHGNSLPLAMMNEISLEIHQAGLDDEVRVVVLKSAGDRAFCGGASFTELSQISTAGEGENFFSGFAHIINSMRKCPKFIVVRVQGKCVGGGVGIVAAADYAIAVTGAEVKLSELEIGIGPFVVGPAVERKIGFSAFSQLAIDAASWRTAEWAKARGLYSEVHVNAQDLDESLQRLVKHLSHLSTDAMKEIKKMFWQGTAHWDLLLAERAKISGGLVTTQSAQRAIALLKPGSNG